MASPLPVIIQGLGPIGRTIAKAALAQPALELVGAVDIADDLVDRPLADVVDGAPAGITIRRTVAQARLDAQAQGGILLHATSSYLRNAAPQFEEALRQGLHVVSTCEELAFAQMRHPDIAAGLDVLARRGQLTIVGTGVNPGFLMDALPASLQSISHDIRSITVTRKQDPSRRRIPFQQKVGMGLSRAEWEAKRDAGGFGHVGLEESARLLAYSLGWKLIDIDHQMEPAGEAGGVVGGTLETLTGTTVDERAIHLHFEANANLEDEYDQIQVDGTPPLDLKFAGGVFGDEATAAAVLRAAKVIPHTRRGIATVLDLPLR